MPEETLLATVDEARDLLRAASELLTVRKADALKADLRKEIADFLATTAHLVE